MLKNFDKIFVVAGIVFLFYGIALIFLGSAPVKPGFLLNIVFRMFDSAWFILSGIFLVYSGVTINKSKDKGNLLFNIAGQLLIFSLVWISTSFIFNIYAMPHIPSSGRIFTFLIQALPRLFSPSLSLEVVIPLVGLIVFGAFSVWFQRVVRKIVSK
jgi:hypothetical protein